MKRNSSVALEQGNSDSMFDDEGHTCRTGTVMTASAHIITAVIGSGVLSLAWAIAQLGWIAGPVTMLVFSFVTLFTSCLQADCYRHPITGARNHTYTEVVRANLGGIKVKLCGMAQYGIIFGVAIGFTITAAISMAAVHKSNCFHQNGHEARCHVSNTLFMVIFAAFQIVLSQIPNFHKLSGLSIVAAIMSFSYSSIGIGLSIAKIASGGHVKTSLTGIPVGGEDGISSTRKIWSTFQALGDIAFAYAFSIVLVEIQDTLKPEPPENVAMRKANLIGVSVTTLFYMSCGVLGYAAFGNLAPGNFLTGFGFYEPFWLVDFGNLCIVIHLVGAYQVFCQPLYGFVETWCRKRWPQSRFIAREYPIATPLASTSFNFFRLVWRTAYVLLTTAIACIFPFFNDVVGLVGAFTFWPLTVYFPVEMYIARAKLQRFSFRWIRLKLLSAVCFVVTLLAALGSIVGLIDSLKTHKPFKSVS